MHTTCIVHLMSHNLTRRKTTGPYTARPNMSGFDTFGKSTAKRLLEQGWVAKRSSKGHLVMRAPDGKTTTALCRDNSAPSIRENTLAPVRRWEERVATPKFSATADGWVCPECQETKASRMSLLGHYNAKHTETRVCAVCGKETKTPAAYFTHMRSHQELFAEDGSGEDSAANPTEAQALKVDEKPELAPKPEPEPEPKREVAKVEKPAKGAADRVETSLSRVMPAGDAGIGEEAVQAVKSLSTTDLVALQSALNQEILNRINDQDARLAMIHEAMTM